MALLSKSGVIIGALAAGAAFFGIAGCGSGGGGVKGINSSANSLVGTWTRSTLSVNDQSVTCPNSLRVNTIVVDSCVAGETIAFTSDGHYTKTIPALGLGRLYQEYGTYSQDGGTLTLRRTATGMDADGSGVISSAETTPLGSVQVVSNELSLGDGSSFDLTPHLPDSTANYTVPTSLDGSSITSTYTR